MRAWELTVWSVVVALGAGVYGFIVMGVIPAIVDGLNGFAWFDGFFLLFALEGLMIGLIGGVCAGVVYLALLRWRRRCTRAVISGAAGAGAVALVNVWLPTVGPFPIVLAVVIGIVSATSFAVLPDRVRGVA